LWHSKIYHIENWKLIHQFNSNDLVNEFGKWYDDILKDLWFVMWDLFYANCLILVEWPVDILYIQYWLEKYMSDDAKQNFIKWQHYDFVEYWWSLAAHLTMKFNPNTDDFDELSTDSLVNIFSYHRNILLITDNDHNTNAFERTKRRLETEISRIQNWSSFYRQSNINTIEDYLTDETTISSDSSNKVAAALVNLKNRRKNSIWLNKFKPEVNELMSKVYNFILSNN